jgi:putative hydrolase of HD superfamily
MKKSKSSLLFLEQALSLLSMPRAHVRTLGNAFDTIASHSFLVAIVAYVITRSEGASHEEGLRAMGMGLLHDLAEARTGDNDFVAKNYVQIDYSPCILKLDILSR